MIVEVEGMMVDNFSILTPQGVYSIGFSKVFNLQYQLSRVANRTYIYVHTVYFNEQNCLGVEV